MVMKSLLFRYGQVRDFIRLGSDLGLIRLDLAASQAELEAVGRAIAARGGEVPGAEWTGRMEAWKEEVKAEVDEALTKGGVRSLGAKMEKLVQVHREMMALTGHDDEVLATSAMNPLKREMADWVVRQVYRRGDQARLIGEVWKWYEAQEELKAKHPLRRDTFTAEVSRLCGKKERGKYRKLTRYMLLGMELP